MSDPIVVYEALKVYLMLGGKAPKVEDDFVIAWMTQDWEDNLLPGKTNEPTRQGARRAICTTCSSSAARTIRPSSSTATLVTEAQAALARMNMADRAYALIKSSAYSAGLTDYYVAAQSGADAGPGLRNPRRHRHLRS